MSTFNLVLLVILAISLFSALLIVAACVMSSRSKSVADRSSAQWEPGKTPDRLVNSRWVGSN